MYIGASEPAIWQREGGRAGVRERVLISGESTRSEAGRDMEREYVLPRETPAPKNSKFKIGGGSEVATECND